MKLSDLFAYLSGISAYNILLSALALTVTLLLTKFLKKRKLKRLYSIMPFAAGIILNLICSLIFGYTENFGEILKKGTETGSTATVIYVIVSGFFKDDSAYEDVPLDSLLLEGLLAGYFPDENLSEICNGCAEIIRNSEGEEMKTALKEKLLSNSEILTEPEADMLIKIISNVLTAAA